MYGLLVWNMITFHLGNYSNIWKFKLSSSSFEQLYFEISDLGGRCFYRIICSCTWQGPYIIHYRAPAMYINSISLFVIIMGDILLWFCMSVDDYCTHAEPAVKCYNQGVCVPEHLGFTCQCVEGYNGTVCDQSTFSQYYHIDLIIMRLDDFNTKYIFL